ncbi:MAG TPA: immunoglobulin domain-containing protein, partial [Saprospiraceae bacterium]|nr:immunoglobulin domain-containing protein [Saprospiraceae bacterium]
SLDCVIDKKSLYDEWLTNNGGLVVSSKCSSISLFYARQRITSILDSISWTKLPPDYEDILNSTNDTLFYLVAATPCGELKSLPIVLLKKLTPFVNIPQNSFCIGDTLPLSVTNFNSGDTIRWIELNNNIERNLPSNNLPFLNYPLTTSNSKIIVSVSQRGCEVQFVDTFDIAPLIKTIKLNKPNDLSLCEAEGLFLVSPNKNSTSFWIDPEGKVFSGDSILLSDKAEVADSGRYRYYIIENGCISDTITFNISVFKNPKIERISRAIKACEGGSATLTVKASHFDSLFWFKNGNLIASTSTDSLKFTNISFADTGVYKISASNLQCSTSDTIQVELMISDKVDVDFTADLKVCEGDSVVLIPIISDYKNLQLILP